VTAPTGGSVCSQRNNATKPIKPVRLTTAPAMAEALVALPLQAAVVLLGRARAHLDHDARILEHVVRSRLQAQRPAHHCHVGLHVPAALAQPELLVR
jgi:hypothetical protein